MRAHWRLIALTTEGSLGGKATIVWADDIGNEREREIKWRGLGTVSPPMFEADDKLLLFCFHVSWSFSFACPAASTSEQKALDAESGSEQIRVFRNMPNAGLDGSSSLAVPLAPALSPHKKSGTQNTRFARPILVFVDGHSSGFFIFVLAPPISLAVLVLGPKECRPCANLKKTLTNS